MALDIAVRLLLIGLVLVACALLLRMLLKYCEFRRCEMAIPGPPSMLFLGNLLDTFSITPDTLLARLIEAWGGRTEISRCSLLNNLFVFVSDPDDLAVAFRSKQFANKSRFFYEFIESDFPKNSVVLHGAEWKRHRTAATPAFHNEVLDSFEDVFVQEAEGFVQSIVPNQEQNPRRGIVHTLSRSFMRTSMSSESNNEQILEVVGPFLSVYFRALNQRTWKPWLWSEWVYKKTATYKTVAEGVAKMRASGLQVLKERKDQLAAETAGQEYIRRRKTLLDALLEAKAGIEHVHIIDEIFIFMGAAVDSTASTLCSAFKCLSLYPCVQERLYAEVKRVLGDAKRSVTLDDVAKMTYLDAFLKETMRVLPAIPFIMRQVNEKTQFAGKVLPAGTTMILNIFGVHHDPRHWAQPLSFNPDRFASDEGRHPYAFIPFSAGPRNCIGQRYAMQFAKVVLATTLRDYRVDRAADGLTDHNQLRITFTLTLSVVGGIRVTFTPRESQRPSDLMPKMIKNISS